MQTQDGQATGDIIALIPARGGSKGIRHKNIQPLGDKPLVAHTIEAALAARQISRVIVSTDDAEIAAVARHHGAEVPFLRPRLLARDQAVVGDVADHLLDHLRRSGEPQPLAYVMLYPTHPFRAPGRIDACCEILRRGHDRVVTVRAIPVGPLTFFRRAGERLIPLVGHGGRFGPPPGPMYRPYGLVEAIRVKPADNPCFFQVIDDPLELIDIDLPEDLRHARALLDSNRRPAARS